MHELGISRPSPFVAVEASRVQVLRRAAAEARASRSMCARCAFFAALNRSPADICAVIKAGIGEDAEDLEFSVAAPAI